MALPYTLTAEFTAAVDDLVQDVALPDSTLQSRAQRLLEVFNETNTTRVKLSPPWVERINKFPSHKTPFTTPNLFNVMCDVAGELGLLAGRRYVYAAICVCGEHVARVGAAPDSNPGQQAADRAQALHQLSSTWVAFLLWPFYAYGHEDRDGGERDDLPPASGDETPTAESIARERRRCWKEQVMARDDFRCFMSGGLDSRAYYAGRPVPPGARVKFCDTVPIISSEVWAHDVPSQDCELQSESSQHLDGSSEQHIILGILARFCGLDAATFAEKAQGPPNTLFVHRSAAKAFTKLLWCLHPTETSDRYEIKSYMPSCDAGCEHVTSHVAFADHSGSGVDLPDRDLVRMHAALAGVLHRSGAVDAFRLLRYHLPWVYGGAGRSVYPASTGSAFWESVVEYEGWDVCREVELWCSDPEPVDGL